MVFTIPRRSSANPVTILFTSSSYGLSRTASLDRKSTRLNSSHSHISYAVFCLKKNKKFETYIVQRQGHAGKPPDNIVNGVQGYKEIADYLPHKATCISFLGSTH